MPLKSSSITADPLETAEAWMRAGREVVIATVIETWGSAPCPVGSHMVVDDEGRSEGCISGGCVELQVVSQAAAVIASGEPLMLELVTTDQIARDLGLSCGGNIKIYLERLG